MGDKINLDVQRRTKKVKRTGQDELGPVASK